MKSRVWLMVAGMVAMVVAEPGLRRAYLDADDGKRHATVEAELEGERGSERLFLRLRPYGVEVEREGGWESRDGVNVHTAREMGSVLRVQGFEARIRGRDGTLRPAKVVWEARYGTFPRRHLRADGSVDYLARTESVVEELEIHTSEDLRGTEGLELLARGEVRLLVDYQIPERGVTGLGMPGHSGAIPIQALEAEQEAVDAMVLPEDWAKRESAGKWSFFTEMVGDDIPRQKRFVQALGEAKDWMFLEEVALYVPGAFGTHSMGVMLHAAKTPNWRRASAWFLRSNQGHGVAHANSMLADPENQAKTLGWFRKHKERLDPALLAMMNQWEKQGVMAEEPDGDLPPWVEDDVFGGMSLALEEPRRVLDDAEVAVVTRAIEGWAVSQRWGSPWGENVIDLIGDPDWRIAQASCLAFSHGTAKAVPMKQLWQVVEDEKKDRRLREAAYLAWSYGTWGEVFPKLHDIVEDFDDPFWEPTMSRLGDLGTGWTLDLLENLKPKKAGQKKLLKQEIQLLQQKFGAGGHQGNDFDATVTGIVLGFRRSADMEDWLLKRYGAEEGTPELRKQLERQQRFLGQDQPPKLHEQAKEVRERLLEELDFRWDQARRKKADK